MKYVIGKPEGQEERPRHVWLEEDGGYIRMYVECPIHGKKRLIVVSLTPNGILKLHDLCGHGHKSGLKEDQNGRIQTILI